MTKDVTLILTTVNAPHSEKLDAEALAHCLKDASAARSKPGHMSSFFGEVPLEAQQAFAASFGISPEALSQAAAAFARYSGETYPQLA